MEAEMKAIRPAALFLSLIAALAFLSSCAKLLDDSYPDYAKRTLAYGDLDAMAKSTSGGSPIQEIDAIGYLESSGSSAAFVDMYTKDGVRRLLTLDGEYLDDPKSYGFDAYGLGPNVGLAASGNYVSGKAAFSAARLPVNLALPFHPSLVSEGGVNYFLDFTPPLTLVIDSYDVGYGSSSTTSIAVAASGSWEFLSAAQSGGWYFLLFRDNGSNEYRAFRTPSIEALRLAASSSAWAYLFGNPSVPAAYQGSEFSSDYGSAWMTVDGPVVKSYANNGVTFTLKSFSGSDKDYTVSDMSNASYSFEPSGKYWFMYDPKSGRLSKLRTWW
jgi:hypothetical protein